MSDLIALALIKQMCREGLLEPSDIDAIAAEVEPRDERAAHLVRVQLVEALATPASDWQAEQRRAQMYAVPTDGGNTD